MSEWQPIDTAPRDGTKILAAAYDDFEKCWVYCVVWWEKLPWNKDGEWQAYYEAFHAFHPFQPTHWTAITPPET